MIRNVLSHSSGSSKANMKASAGPLPPGAGRETLMEAVLLALHVLLAIFGFLQVVDESPPTLFPNLHTHTKNAHKAPHPALRRLQHEDHREFKVSLG